MRTVDSYLMPVLQPLTPLQRMKASTSWNSYISFYGNYLHLTVNKSGVGDELTRRQIVVPTSAAITPGLVGCLETEDESNNRWIDRL